MYELISDQYELIKIILLVIVLASFFLVFYFLCRWIWEGKGFGRDFAISCILFILLIFAYGVYEFYMSSKRASEGWENYIEMRRLYDSKNASESTAVSKNSLNTKNTDQSMSGGVVLTSTETYNSIPEATIPRLPGAPELGLSLSKHEKQYITRYLRTKFRHNNANIVFHFISAPLVNNGKIINKNVHIAYHTTNAKMSDIERALYLLVLNMDQRSYEITPRGNPVYAGDYSAVKDISLINEDDNKIQVTKQNNTEIYTLTCGGGSSCNYIKE